LRAPRHATTKTKFVTRRNALCTRNRGEQPKQIRLDALLNKRASLCLAQLSGTILQRHVVRVKTCRELARDVIPASLEFVRLANNFNGAMKNKKAPTG
jgi:hypothetical protein